jgi:acetyl esterase/lipase
MPVRAADPRKGIHLDYLGKEISADDPRLDVLGAIGGDYPPAYITTACHDFLRDCAEPMYHHLTEKGVRAQWKCYGTEADKTVGHVFHVNIPTPEAIRCNDDAAAFFQSVLSD